MERYSKSAPAVSFSDAFRQADGCVFNELVIDLCLAGRLPAKWELYKHSGYDLIQSFAVNKAAVARLNN